MVEFQRHKLQAQIIKFHLRNIREKSIKDNMNVTESKYAEFSKGDH